MSRTNETDPDPCTTAESHLNPMRHSRNISSVVIVLIVTSIFVVSCGAPLFLTRRVTNEFNCPEESLTWERLSPTTHRMTGCGKTATYFCNQLDGSDCRLEGTISPIGAAPQPASASGSRLPTEEINRVMFTVTGEVQQCLNTVPNAPSVVLQVQINGDGSVIYMGAEPSPPPQVSTCLRRVVNTVRVRAMGGQPFVHSTPPYSPHD